jgi:hypothetical protein
MYIVWDDNIFMSKLTFVQFTRVKAQTPQLRITSSRVASTAISAQGRRQPDRGFTISRAGEYHKIDSSLSIGEPAHGAWINNVEGFDHD